MLRRGFKAAAEAVRASPPRPVLWAAVFLGPGLAAAVLVGAGQSQAQDDYPPVDPPTTTYPGTTPTTTSPALTPSPTPNQTPTTTAPVTTPPPAPAPGKNTIVIKGTSIETYRFSPRRLRVRRGKRVRWAWNSNAPHNVVFRRPRKRSRTLFQGRFTLRLRKRGTYRYLCTVHDFGGRIVVR
jgi:plastocyanin